MRNILSLGLGIKRLNAAWNCFRRFYCVDKGKKQVRSASTYSTWETAVGKQFRCLYNL